MELILALKYTLLLFIFSPHIFHLKCSLTSNLEIILAYYIFSESAEPTEYLCCNILCHWCSFKPEGKMKVHKKAEIVEKLLLFWL